MLIEPRASSDAELAAVFGEYVGNPYSVCFEKSPADFAAPPSVYPNRDPASGMMGGCRA